MIARALPVVLLLVGCAEAEVAVSARRLALEDPDGVLGELAGPLRLLVMPGTTHTCIPSAGVLDPSPAHDGPVDGFIRDTSFPLDGEARVSVPPGELAVLVRGRDAGGALAATGCAEVDLFAGETREIGVVMRRAVTLGQCGNGVVEPGEECDDGGDPARRLEDGDGCDERCRTEPFTPETGGSASLAQARPAAGWHEEGRLALVWNLTQGTRNLRARLYARDGRSEALPPSLRQARDLEAAPGTQTEASVAAGAGRFAVAWTDLGAGRPDVRVGFYEAEGLVDEVPPRPPTDDGGTQGAPAVAVDGRGHALVVLEDDASESGLHGRLFVGEPPSAEGAPWVIGVGGAGARAPAVAWSGTRWIVAFGRGDDLLVEVRDGAGDTVRAPAVVAGGELAAGAPALTAAAVPGEATLLVWRRADAAGGGIRARLLDPEGTPRGQAFDLDTTRSAPREAPAAAAFPGGFAVVWQHGEAIRGRFVDPAGLPLRNRDRFPSTDDFLVTGGPAAAPAVAAGGDGWLAFAWEDTAGEVPRVTARLVALP